MNSRTLNSPARGRGSSRSFVLKWYQRCQHLLVADGVHLLADDLDDLLMDAPAERQERPQSRTDLPDEASTREQLVTRGLRIRRRLTQRRKKKL